MPNHNTFTINLNNTELFGQYWEVNNAKATLLYIHGMGEHSGRLTDHFTPFFNNQGFNVIAFDHYGHGKTKGKRGACPSYTAVLDSVRAFSNKAKELWPNLPLVHYGHSMGGNVLANYLIKRNDDVTCAIISSPMLRLSFNPPSWKLTLGKLMVKIYPGFQEKTGLDANAISRDSAEIEKYINDPLIHDKITAGFSIPFFDAGEWAISHANELKTTSLVIHGTEDKLTDYKGSEAFAKNASKHAELKLYDGGYHELHNDTIKETVLNDIVAWINSKLTA